MKSVAEFAVTQNVRINVSVFKGSIFHRQDERLVRPCVLRREEWNQRQMEYIGRSAVKSSNFSMSEFSCRYPSHPLQSRLHAAQPCGASSCVAANGTAKRDTWVQNTRETQRSRRDRDMHEKKLRYQALAWIRFRQVLLV